MLMQIIKKKLTFLLAPSFLMFIVYITLNNGTLSRFEFDPHDEPTLYLVSSFKNVGADWGPLYVMWYSVLSFITRCFEPYSIYLLSVQLQSFLFVLIVFLLMRKIKLSVVGSSLTALILLFTPLLFHIPRRPNHFALICFLIFLYLSLFPKHLSRQLLIISLGTIAAAYIRPEFFLIAFPLIFVSLIFYALSLIKKKISFSFYDIPLIGFIFTPIAFFGSPNLGQGGKSLHVFLSKNTERFGPNQWKDISFWSDIYKKPHSILEAFFSNPHEFLRHIYFNLTETCISFFSFIQSYTLLPLLFSLFALFFFLTFFIFSKKEQNKIPLAFYLGLFLLLIPDIFICFIYGPLVQYLVPVYTALILFFTSYLFSRELVRSMRFAWILFAAVSISCAAFFVVIPPPADEYGFVRQHVTSMREILKNEPLHLLTLKTDLTYPWSFLLMKGHQSEMTFCTDSFTQVCCRSYFAYRFTPIDTTRCYQTVDETIKHENINVVLNIDPIQENLKLGPHVFTLISLPSLFEWHLYLKKN